MKCSKTKAKTKNLFSEEEIHELRQEFWMLFKKEQKSYSTYSLEIGIGNTGGTLIDFLHESRVTTDHSLMKIRNYLESKRSRGTYETREKQKHNQRESK